MQFSNAEALKSQRVGGVPLDPTKYECELIQSHIPVSFRSRGAEPSLFARAHVWYVGSTDKPHNVVLAHVPGKPEFFMWCGDNFLEKGANPDEISQVIGSVDSAAPEKEHLSDLEALLSDKAGSLNKSSGCNFWRNSQSCKHTKHVLSAVTDEQIDQLMEPILGESSSAAAGTADSMGDKLVRYAFRKHVLIEGDKGAGKTVEVQRFNRDEGIEEVQLNGHEGIESLDILGYEVRHGSSFVWKDGRLAQAFRMASKGGRVALFIDEIARIPQRELNILVGALSPDMDGNYRLPTGRMVDVVDGIGVEETLTVAKDNLWVVATMNVGAGYAVEDIDEALTDRFRIFRKDTTKDGLKAILAPMVKGKKFKVTVLDGLISFWEKAGRLRRQGELSRPVNTRHLCESIELADSPDEVSQNLRDCVLNWTDRDANGLPIQSQIELMLDLVPSFTSKDARK